MRLLKDAFEVLTRAVAALVAGTFLACGLFVMGVGLLIAQAGDCIAKLGGLETGS